MIKNHEDINDEHYFSLIVRILITIFLGLLLLVFIFWYQAAYARTLYPDQYAQYTDQERNWFKGVKSPNKVPCCDIADGYKTTWKGIAETDINSSYAVPICEKTVSTCDDWYPVPKAAMIYNAGNPFDEAIVWYVDQGIWKAEGDEIEHHHYYIRCFVPSGGV